MCMTAAGSVARHRQFFNFAFFQSIKLNRVHVCAHVGCLLSTYCEVKLIVFCTLLSSTT